eukprot:124346-Amphidinium_carterae.1
MSSEVSTRLLVLREGYLCLMVGMGTMIRLLMLIWTCYMVRPIRGSCPVPAEEDSAEHSDQVSSSLPGESTATRFSDLPESKATTESTVLSTCRTRDTRSTGLSVLSTTPLSSKFTTMPSRACETGSIPSGPALLCSGHLRAQCL